MEQQGKRVSKLGLAVCINLSVGQLSFAGIDEIIVTAQKREQNLQEVPIAVSALSGPQLNNLSITDVFDLQDSVPALAVRQNQSATTSNFSIRGVGTSGSNFGLESSVGLYVDGVYRARQNSMINEMVDMAGVEVLRGPQGTLFGRNTSAGAVLMKTVAPSQEAGGYLSTSVGNLGLVSVQGATGGAIVKDLLAWRLSGFTSDRDGYVSDLNLGADNINDRNREGVRLQFLVTPSDDLRIRIIGDYSRIDEICCAAVTLKNNYQVYARDSLTGGYASTASFGTDSILALPSTLLIPGTPVAGFGVPVIGEERVFDDLVSLTSLPESSNRDKGLSVQADWDLAAGTFTSITGWRAFESADYVDGDFSSIDIFSRREKADQQAFTQEFRFQFSGDRVEGVVGSYYFQQSLDTLSDTFIGADANDYIALSVYSQASALGGQAVLAGQGGDLSTAQALQSAALSAIELANAMVFGLENISLDPSSSLYPLQAAGFSGPAFPATASGLNDISQDHQAWALFGQFDYSISPSLILTAGLRYTSEEKDIRGIFSEPGASWGALLGLSDLTIVNPRQNVDESLKDEQLTGTVKLSWFPVDDMMLFASFGTGYKSGGTNTDRINPVFDVIFEAETSETFELGMKADIPSRHLRLNLTLHHTTTEDYQTNAFQGNGFNLSNAGEVEARGGELEIWWSPTATFDANFAYVYNKAEFKGFERANCWIAYSWLTGIQDPGRQSTTDQYCDRSGGPLDTNPEHSFIIGATKVFAVEQGQEIFVHGDYVYRDEQYMDSNLDPFKVQDGYGLVNARAGFRLLAEGVELAFWGRNLFDKDYLNVHFDVPLQFGKLNAYTGEPRTYGATLRVEF